ncbi:MAG: carbohydrate porin [Planctomycetaceae bacterium]
MACFFADRPRAISWARRLLVLALVACAPVARAQDPVILPGIPGASLPAGERPAPDPPFADEIAANAAEAPGPAKTPAFGVTGDWLGYRTGLSDSGISFKTNVSQFYQGLASGGLGDGFDYGLKFDYFGVIGGEKLLGWRGLYLNLHGETRLGQSINTEVGSLLLVDFALFFPQPTGSATALTNFQIQQFATDEFVFYMGKINTADGVNIHPFMGGYGTDRFLNTAFVINPMLGRVLPYSTPGAGFTYLQDLDPVFTTLIVDPMGQPGKSGLDNLFTNGLSLFTQLRLPVKPFGLPGHQFVDFAYSNGAFSSLSPDDYVINPGVGFSVVEQTGTWAVSYGFDQFLVVAPENSRKGWGVFGNLGVSDGDPNPIRWFLNVGLAGMSPVRGRSDDSFGAAYFYMGASTLLKTLLPLRDEHGCELYYDLAVTPWFRLTADVQAINPGQRAADSALVLGLRAKIIL